jgi:hypothetical protein
MLSRKLKDEPNVPLEAMFAGAVYELVSLKLLERVLQVTALSFALFNGGGHRWKKIC